MELQHAHAAGVDNPLTMKALLLNKILLLSFIALVSLAMHFRHFKKDLVSIHAWRQAQTQTYIVNFYEEDFNIFNPRQNNRGDGDGIYRREFPLMQWMVAGTYKIFGNHLIITRIWMFFIGLFTIAGIYELVFRVFNHRISAAIAAWTFCFSPAFFYYTINPHPDNLALCCSVWGLAFFFKWKRDGILRHLVFSGLLLSAGALCKLPFILHFTVPWTYFILVSLRDGKDRNALPSLSAVSVPAILPLAWYAWVIPQWTGEIGIMGMLDNPPRFVVLLDYLQHNLISTLPELLLGYGTFVFFLAGLYFLFRNRLHRKRSFPVYLVWGIVVMAYFLYELNVIAKIHDYYLFPFYPLLFLLVGYGAQQILHAGKPYLKYACYLLIAAAPLICHARMIGRWDLESPGFNRDMLTYKQELREAVPKNALCVAGNDISYRIFFYYIDKKGWPFTGDNLDAEQLEEMISRGAAYLYCDSRKVDQDPQILPFLEDQVSEFGSIRIFRLTRRPQAICQHRIGDPGQKIPERYE
jgi:hypothetical protein